MRKPHCTQNATQTPQFFLVSLDLISYFSNNGLLVNTLICSISRLTYCEATRRVSCLQLNSECFLDLITFVQFLYKIFHGTHSILMTFSSASEFYDVAGYVILNPIFKHTFKHCNWTIGFKDKDVNQNVVNEPVQKFYK